MCDNYEFFKSTYSEGLGMETPYSNKQYGYINDINGGVYSNNGLSLVQFDLSSIYNSNVLVDPSQMYITVPLVMVSAYTSNVTTGGLVAPTASDASWATHGLKNGYFQILHGADLVVNGKTINQFQPNINSYINFKMLSQMCQDDLKTLGTTLGMGEVLDNPQSMRFNPAVNSVGGNAQPCSTPVVFPATSGVITSGLVGGNGLVNNSPFSSSGGFQLITTGLCATTTTGTALTITAANSAIIVGMLITGTGIAPNTFVTAYNGNVTLAISVACSTEAAPVPISFWNFSSNGGDESYEAV